MACYMQRWLKQTLHDFIPPVIKTPSRELLSYCTKGKAELIVLPPLKKVTKAKLISDNCKPILAKNCLIPSPLKNIFN